MTQAEKQEIIKAYATHEGDTGSPEVQVAVLTTRSEPIIAQTPAVVKRFCKIVGACQGHTRYGIKETEQSRNLSPAGGKMTKLSPKLSPN